MGMTPGERTAVRFLVAVAVLGSGVRVAAQWRHRGADDPVAVEALHRQRAAVDSARLAARASKPARRDGRSGGRAAKKAAAPVGRAGDGVPMMTMWPAEAGGPAGASKSAGDARRRRTAMRPVREERAE